MTLINDNQLTYTVIRKLDGEWDGGSNRQRNFAFLKIKCSQMGVT